MLPHFNGPHAPNTTMVEPTTLNTNYITKGGSTTLESPRSKFVDGIAETYAHCLALIRAKTQDYATVEDPYRNFRMAGNLGVSLEQGIIVRMGDKLSRIANLIKSQSGPAVATESVEDTLLDLINYSAILLQYIKDQSTIKSTRIDLPE